MITTAAHPNTITIVIVSIGLNVGNELVGEVLLVVVLDVDCIVLLDDVGEGT